METIYDVLRLLVSKGTGILSDAEIAIAHKIINAHETAHPAPAADDGADSGGGDA